MKAIVYMVTLPMAQFTANVQRFACKGVGL